MGAEANHVSEKGDHDDMITRLLFDWIGPANGPIHVIWKHKRRLLR